MPSVYWYNMAAQSSSASPVRSWNQLKLVDSDNTGAVMPPHLDHNLVL